jgi:hypothetical protein
VLNHSDSATSDTGCATSPMKAARTGTNRRLVSVIGVATSTTVTPADYMYEQVDQASQVTVPAVTVATSSQSYPWASATGTRVSTSANAATSAAVTFAIRPAPATSSYLYDVDRQQVLRKDPYAVFLSLGGFIDLHVVPNGAPWSNRHYEIGDEPVAKNSGGVREWFANDNRRGASVGVTLR